MKDFRGVFYREYKLLTGNRTNLLLSISSVLMYILLFASAMTNLIPRVPYQGASIRYIDFALPALMVLSMVSAAHTTATSLFQERLARMDVELWSYPVRKSSYVAAKVAAATALVLVQTTLALALALTVFRLTWPARHVVFVVLASLLAIAALTGGYLLLATLVSNHQRFMVVSNIIGPLMLFSSASFYPPQAMPDVVRWVSYVNPMTYAIRAVRDAALFGTGGEGAGFVAAALGAAALSSWALVVRGLVARARNL